MWIKIPEYAHKYNISRQLVEHRIKMKQIKTKPGKKEVKITLVWDENK